MQRAVEQWQKLLVCSRLGAAHMESNATLMQKTESAGFNRRAERTSLTGLDTVVRTIEARKLKFRSGGFDADPALQ